MKILFVHGGEKLKEDNQGNYYTDGSYNKDVWKRYEKLSNDITVIFRKDKDIYDVNYAQNKFEVFDKTIYKYIETEDFMVSIKKYFDFQGKKKDNKKIEENVKDCDLVISRVPSRASYIAIKYAKKYKKKYIIELVGCPFDTLWNHSLKGKILAIPQYLKLKTVVKNAKFVTYVSDSFLQKRYPTKGIHLACSDVVINEAKEEDLKERMDKIVKNDCKKIILGTVGTLNLKYKGQQYVIRAISELKKKGYKCEYQMVGGGDNSFLKSIAKKYNVEEDVKFLGNITHDRVFKFLKGIDIYIQPSDVEGLCRSLIEAMSMACPCIASDAGENPELIDNEFIFKKKKWKEIINIVSNYEKESQMIEAIRNFENSRKFEMNKLSKKRENFYKKI